jgi:Trk K+ transport system NAD-binding subunit
VALTVRTVSATVPIVATAAWENSVALLTRAGCHEVVQLGEMLGKALAVRIAGQDGQAHVVGGLDDLLMAEAAAGNTPLVGKTLRELALGERLNVIVAGVWERGRYVAGAPDLVVRQDSVLLLSGTREALDAYNRDVRTNQPAPTHVVIIGGGSVGRATARHLEALGIDYAIIEQTHDRLRDWSKLVIGDATNPDVLRQAGLDRAQSVAITTRDDDVNTYVTLQCRELRRDVQILTRVTHERNLQTLYQAGADVVLSYFPMEANAIFGVLQRGQLLILAEGLDLFVVQVPRSLIGRNLATAGIRQTTGCNVIAVRAPGGTAEAPNPQEPLAAGTQLLIVGDRESAKRLKDVVGS